LSHPSQDLSASWAGTVPRPRPLDLVQRSKTPPKGAALFVADCLTRDKGLLNEYHADEIAAELLGVSDTNALRKQATGLGANGDARAQVITLALVLGALESRTPKDAWRNPGSGWLNLIKGSEYLQFLAAQGYTLSPVEDVVTGSRDSEGVYQEFCS
jgi:ParB family transcriptional regulator, chromosome partitioning protein